MHANSGYAYCGKHTSNAPFQIVSDAHKNFTFYKGAREQTSYDPIDYFKKPDTLLIIFEEILPNVLCLNDAERFS